MVCLVIYQTRSYATVAALARDLKRIVILHKSATFQRWRLLKVSLTQVIILVLVVTAIVEC